MHHALEDSQSVLCTIKIIKGFYLLFCCLKQCLGLFMLTSIWLKCLVVVKVNIYTHWPLYLFNCLLIQISNQPITWQQLNAFRHVDTVKTSCWSSSHLINFESGMVVGVLNLLVWVFQELPIICDFHRQPSQGFIDNILKKLKYTVSGRSVSKNAMLLPEDARLVGDDRQW